MVAYRPKPHETNGHTDNRRPALKPLGNGTVPQASARPKPVYKSDLPELARKPDFMLALANDIAAIGHVGEKNNARLVYVVYSSRVLENPNSVIVRGRTCAGKSTLLNNVASLFPASVKIEAMAMTTAAWFNTEPDFFQGKLFLAGERQHSTDDTAKDASAMLRQLLSENKISRGVSILNKETKLWETKWIERSGPIVYASSTTAEDVFVEDLNRVLQLYADDSVEQTRRVITSIAAKYDPDAQPMDREAICRRHHEFQQWLQEQPRRRVGIPFHQAIADGMPADYPAVRRSIRQVLSIIEALVVLQQCNRQERNGCLLATLNDYALARRLLLAPLHAAIGIGKEYERAKELRGKLKDEFTQQDIKKAGNFTNDMAVSRFVTALRCKRFLDQVREGKGRNPAVYKWREGEFPDLDSLVLPPVEVVKRFV